jgi:calcineurin-like phosphoesterase family protein
MATFVTSNLQLGRPAAIKKYGRSCKDVSEMNEMLIQNWNSVVSDGDIVYHLGNFALDPKTAQDALSRLNGRIFLMPAELDESVQTLATKGMLPKTVSLMNRITTMSQFKSNLSYWPMAEWPEKKKGFWSVIGYPEKKYKSDPRQKTINVSTDLWGNKPQDLEKLLEIFQDI